MLDIQSIAEFETAFIDLLLGAILAGFALSLALIFRQVFNRD